MSSIILVYTTDVWHTDESKELIGVFTREKEMYRQLKKIKTLSEWDLEFLRENNQTQGDSESDRDYEIVIEKWERDALNSLNID